MDKIDSLYCVIDSLEKISKSNVSIKNADSIFTMLKDIQDNSNHNFWFGFLGIMVAIISVFIQYKSIQDTIKGNTEITFRQQWIDNIRNTLSELLGELNRILNYLYDHTNRREEINWKKLYTMVSAATPKIVKLKLLFNSDRRLDQELAFRLLENIETFFTYYINKENINRVTNSDFTDARKDLINLTKIILIREWRRVQKENMVSGENLNSESKFEETIKKIAQRLKIRELKIQHKHYEKYNRK